MFSFVISVTTILIFTVTLLMLVIASIILLFISSFVFLMCHWRSAFIQLNDNNNTIALIRKTDVSRKKLWMLNLQLASIQISKVETIKRFYNHKLEKLFVTIKNTLETFYWLLFTTTTHAFGILLLSCLSCDLVLVDGPVNGAGGSVGPPHVAIRPAVPT